MSCMVDRICTKRTITPDWIEMGTEPSSGEIVVRRCRGLLLVLVLWLSCVDIVVVGVVVVVVAAATLRHMRREVGLGRRRVDDEFVNATKAQAGAVIFLSNDGAVSRPPFFSLSPCFRRSILERTCLSPHYSVRRCFSTCFIVFDILFFMFGPFSPLLGKVIAPPPLAPLPPFKGDHVQASGGWRSSLGCTFIISELSRFSRHHISPPYFKSFP